MIVLMLDETWFTTISIFQIHVYSFSLKYFTLPTFFGCHVVCLNLASIVPTFVHKLLLHFDGFHSLLAVQTKPFIGKLVRC